jgi:hypothetical protein
VGVSQIRDPILRLFIRDFDTQVVPGSVRLFLDGLELAPLVVTDHTDGVHAEYPHRLSLSPGTTPTAKVEFSDDQNPPLVTTIEWSFYVEPLTHDTLFIEAEDFNFSNDGVTGGLHANFGDAECSLFGKDAIRGVDYYESVVTNSQSGYRGPTAVESWGITANDAIRAESTNACDYIVRSDQGGNWYNYTRHFRNHASYFRVYLRASSATGGRVRLDSVDLSGAATNIATFNVAATANTNQFTFTPLRDDSSSLVPLPLCAERTLRLTIVEGEVDLNYLALVPMTGEYEPSRVAFVYPQTTNHARAPLIKAEIQNWEAAVISSTIKIFFDCIDVTPQATVTDLQYGAMVSYQAPEYSPLGTRHYVRIEWQETDRCGLPSRSYEWSYLEGPYNPERNLFIEAEDFDTAGGHYFPSNPATTNHFNQKGLYQGSAAIHDVDYRFEPQTSAPAAYRAGLSPVVGMREATDNGTGVRPGFELTTDYRIGWNTPGNWYSYTRFWSDQPWHHVYLRASHEMTNSRIHGELSLVHTNGTTQRLGVFDGAATGSWDVFGFIPLINDSGYRHPVRLTGERTLRYTVLSGDPLSADLNYLMFVPFPPFILPAPFIRFQKCDVDGLMQLVFSGVLQSAEDITGPWHEVTNAPNPLVIRESNGRQKFWRVVHPSGPAGLDLAC